jgi:glyoxylase-like metal-dependent hydrolase (beta-lactamase superfamily II)
LNEEKFSFLTVVPVPSGPVSTNAYLIICNETNNAAVVDPSAGSFVHIARLIKKHKSTLTHLLFTHSHWDHIADASQFVQEFHPEVVIHSEDSQNLITPGSDRVPCWISISGIKPTHLISDGDTIAVGQSHWHVIHTPGHTPGGVCYHCEEEMLLISGDTIFKGTIGRLDLPTGEPDRMWKSLEKLSKLPPETVVFPGHGPKTTIGREKWLANPKEHFS